MHVLKDFKPKIPAKFHSNSLLKKCYFFLFILHNKYSGKNMPCKAGGIPPCKKYQIASDNKVCWISVRSLAPDRNSSIPCSQINNADGVIPQVKNRNFRSKPGNEGVSLSYQFMLAPNRQRRSINV